MLLINCSNREKNCYKVLKDLSAEKDVVLSLSNKDMRFCLGCDQCSNDLEKHCVLDDYITNHVYDAILASKDIVIASPLYMSNINAILKNLLDRMNPFYHHELLRDKKIYLILTGQASKEDNEEEINRIIEYFNSIKEWLYFDFEFLEYFEGYNEMDDVHYDQKIQNIRDKFDSK